MALQAAQNNRAVHFTGHGAAETGIAVRDIPAHRAHDNIINRDALPARREGSHIGHCDFCAWLRAITFIERHLLNLAPRHGVIAFE